MSRCIPVCLYYRAPSAIWPYTNPRVFALTVYPVLSSKTVCHHYTVFGASYCFGSQFQRSHVILAFACQPTIPIIPLSHFREIVHSRHMTKQRQRTVDPKWFLIQIDKIDQLTVHYVFITLLFVAWQKQRENAFWVWSFIMVVTPYCKMSVIVGEKDIH